MASIIDDLVQKFHNLSGITLSERKKSFNHYLTEIKRAFKSLDNKKELVKCLKPTNRLEDIFYTTILLELEENEALLNILYTNDILLRKMVLNSDVFMKDMYEIIVVDDFSSEVSFVVRLRILIRLGEILQDDNRLDRYYYSIRKKYGIHLAKNLLPGCMMETITVEMEQNRVLFNNKQLTKIYNRFPDFLEAYFDHLVQNNFKKFGVFDKLIRHVALTNVDIYWTLLKKFELKTKISKQSTIKLLIKHYDEILHEGEKYIDILQKNAAFKFFTLDKFKILYAKLFPKYFNDVTKENFNGSDKEIIKWLNKRVPNRLRFNILNDVFKQLYNSEILAHDELFTEELLEIVPTDLRTEIIAKKIETDKSDDWLCFHDLEKAQNILRQRISITSDPNKRRHYVFLLVKACKINRDTQRLIEVLEFINARHRNEDAALFHCIFKYLTNFDLKKFEAGHWDEINKMIRIYFVTRHNEYDYSDKILNNCFEGYFDFRIRQNLPIEEEALKYLKLYFKDYHLMLFKSKKDKEKYKMMLNMYVDMIPKTFVDNHLRHACSFYLQSIVDYNKDYPQDFQDLTKHEFMVKYINDVIDDDDDEGFFRCYIVNGINNLKYNKEVYKKVADKHWTSLAERENLQWLHFIKNNPEYCVKYYEKFFDLGYYNKDTKNYEDLVQYYTHLGLPQVYEKTAKEYLTNPDLKGQSYNFEVALRFLVHSEEFVEVIERFLPKEEYNNTILEVEDVNLITVKKTLGAVFGKCKNLEKVLKPLMALSKSDYLKNCLQSIYKIAYNMPENKLKNFMGDVSGGLDSLSRHAIYITTAISDQQTVYQTLKRIGKSEELYSVRKCLLNSTLNYFFLNPCDELFELVKTHCCLINLQDPEGYDMWLKFDKIPVQYLVKYVEFIWEFTQENEHEEVKNLKYKILEKLDENRMKHFGREFLDIVIKECANFESVEIERNYEVLYRFIMVGKLENVFDRLKLITLQFPKDTFDCDVKTSKNILNFTFGLCERILNEKKKFNHDAKLILKTYKQLWQEIYSIQNNFEQYVYLKFTEFSYEDDFKYDKYNQNHLVANVIILLGQIIGTFGTYIIPNFASVFIKFFTSLMRVEELQPEEELLKFLLDILEKPEEENLLLQRTDREYFALICLPKVFPKLTNARVCHSQILEVLKKTKSNSIRVNITCYTNSKEELMQ